MAENRTARRLIVNADDFGLSASINDAVIRAHREGILTTASLMVAGAAADAAIALARQNPRLGVGMHLVLVFGRATLPAVEIPGLVDAKGHFSYEPVRTGLRYFLQRALREQLRREIAAQLAAFAATGLPLDHVNGHLNLHLHPTVFRQVLTGRNAVQIPHLRLTRDRFWLNTKLAGGEWIYRISHAVIFNLLAAWARPQLRHRGIRHTQSVFGLLQNGRVDESFVLGLIPRLPAGDSELYSHPSLTEFSHEFDALVSPRVRAVVQTRGVQLIRYQDL